MIEITIADTRICHQAVKLSHVGSRLRRTMHIWLRDNFDQWRARTVEINQTIAGVVRQLARIGFDMCVVNTYMDGSTVFEHGIDVASEDGRLIHLRDLVATGQIRVKIMFAVKPTNAGNLSIQRLASPNCEINCVSVENW